jgi:flagellar assembly factor FliW
VALQEEIREEEEEKGLITAYLTIMKSKTAIYFSYYTQAPIVINNAVTVA